MHMYKYKYKYKSSYCIIGVKYLCFKSSKTWRFFKDFDVSTKHGF